MSDETKQEKKGLYLLHIDGGNKASAAGEMGEGAIGVLLKEPNGTAIPGVDDHATLPTSDHRISLGSTTACA